MQRTANAFQRLPTPVAVVVSALLAGLLGLAIGIGGALLAIYVHDRGNSKGDNWVVGISALFGVGTFVFVTALCWLSKAHHRITWRTPLLSLTFCFVFPVIATVYMGDSYYS